MEGFKRVAALAKSTGQLHILIIDVEPWDKVT
jgi:hypothetical protein